MDNTQLLIRISKVGKEYSYPPLIKDIFPFQYYFDEKENLIKNKLNEIDGLWTRREILTRFLFLQAVLDQGPDIVGVRQLLKNVINTLYKKEIRILHKPLDFFKEIGISVDEILQKHKEIKSVRSVQWATENKSTPNRYNLFMDNAKQVLGYAVYRWGVPLAVPYLLEQDLKQQNKESNEPLVNYIESFVSAEIMSQQIKDNERYGLGKAIGDKAAHLFAKWYIYTFALNKRNDDISFNNLSYELPFDSNVGRVLFRSGFLLELATLEEYETMQFININAGKGGKHYLRVTNLRGQKTHNIDSNSELGISYMDIVTKYFKTKTRPTKKIEIQQTINAYLKSTEYGIGHLDDGIIYIGTNFCYNHETPKCKQCPINDLCLGYKEKNELINDYRT